MRWDGGNKMWAEMLDDLRNMGKEMWWRRNEGLQRMNQGEKEKQEDKKDEKRRGKEVMVGS